MRIKAQIENDLKQAMLAGDKNLVTTLRGLKSAIQYAEVAKGARAEGLPDNEIIQVLAKEAKKRQESADMYIQGDSMERANAEAAEKLVIEKYLPAQMSKDEVDELVRAVVDELNVSGMQAMGQVIAKVKERSKGAADGAMIAQIVKETLSQ
jgi:uncharacterized protein